MMDSSHAEQVPATIDSHHFQSGSKSFSQSVNIHPRSSSTASTLIIEIKYSFRHTQPKGPRCNNATTADNKTYFPDRRERQLSHGSIRLLT